MSRTYSQPSRTQAFLPAYPSTSQVGAIIVLSNTWRSCPRASIVTSLLMPQTVHLLMRVPDSKQVAASFTVPSSQVCPPEHLPPPPEHAARVQVIRTAMRTSAKIIKRFLILLLLKKMPQVVKTYGIRLFFGWGNGVHAMCGACAILV